MNPHIHDMFSKICRHFGIFRFLEILKIKCQKKTSEVSQKIKCQHLKNSLSCFGNQISHQEKTWVQTIH